MVQIKSKISKPEWLKIQLPNTADYNWMHKVIRDNALHTICTSGKCPNAAECWARGTATFMILGDICTRACKFCNVKTGRPLPPDTKEPLRIARSIQIMKIKHAVITSVDRDDLPDGGAHLWADTINKVKELNPDTTMEVLIPDFNGKGELIQIVMDAKPEVISHNMETVRRLTPTIRSKAKYDVSLQTLKYIVDGGLVAKSGIMLGLGETEEEAREQAKKEMSDYDILNYLVDAFGDIKYLLWCMQQRKFLEEFSEDIKKAIEIYFEDNFEERNEEE